MFEVGKLTDESLDSFLGELEKASLTFFFHFLANESTVLSVVLETLLYYSYKLAAIPYISQLFKKKLCFSCLLGYNYTFSLNDHLS